MTMLHHRPNSRPMVIPVTMVLLAFVFARCDSSETGRVCTVAGVDNHFKTAPFRGTGASAIAEFKLEQKITTYETGDCEKPSSDDDGVRILVTNLTRCHLDLDYSLSVIEGRIGWTITGLVGVDAERTTDTGKVVKRSDPAVDVAQVILTGTATASNCQ